MGRDVIIACDFKDRKTFGEFLGLFKDQKPFLKIGMELFYAEGKELLAEIKKRGHKIFLDLKLHDIPNTVAAAMRVLSNYDIDMVNVHAQGTVRMMQEAEKALAAKDGKHPLLIAVTQLTSTSEEAMQRDLLVNRPLPEVVLHYARNAQNSGLDGVVCSPWEAPVIHEKLGSGFLTVTPGVRFAENSKDDQARVATPAKAKELGSDYIVVGRAITKASDPVQSYLRCLREFCD